MRIFLQNIGQKNYVWKQEEDGKITLKKISSFIGYSEFHTSRKFKQYTGSTLRRYIMLRRLSSAAKEIRDHNVRLIDVAIKYGFSSQEAFTKSFKQAFDITPGEYQRTKKAIPYILKKDVLFPNHLREKGDVIMVKDSEIRIRLEEVAAHKFVYLEKEGVDNYISFWEEMEKEGHDCDLLHGVLASIEGVYPEGYGAFTNKGYIFGTDAPLDYRIDPKYKFKEATPELLERIREHKIEEERERIRKSRRLLTICSLSMVIAFYFIYKSIML